ncbi:hypothetical protein H2199_008763 [Coniosporium tulheliwenetii]|uniref:Uncharacterized protein n=1 Tax=Coniosporium tulheliwenetii TaxID=3383036 RepID=A0ACC2YHQ6_9PEZI|nr:hypothetical protein H2199_008763 [Cladosporium sp. JES 115]
MSESNSSSPSRAYPPPANVMLPPPVPSAPSSSSHSSRKRKRSEGDSAVASSASSTSQFSKRTKQKVIEWDDGGKCWHCGGGAPDVCHVIARKDSSFGRYVDNGLLTFDSLGDEQNAIPLCPSCHRAFDNVNDPGLVFIPTDIPYFIDFEKKDFENRTDIARRLGYVPPRMTPKPQAYLEHQVSQGILSSDACGGQYWRYTLRDYFPVNADKSFIPGLGPFKEPGLWHGAPMAALRRAFQVLGDPVVEGIPEEQMNALWELRKLYSRKVETGNQDGSRLNDGVEATVGEGSHQTPGTRSSGHDTASAVGGQLSPSATNAIGNSQSPQAEDQAVPPASDATLKPHEAASSPLILDPMDKSTARIPQQNHQTPPSTTHGRLLIWGAGSTAESNVLRYLKTVQPYHFSSGMMDDTLF